MDSGNRVGTDRSSGVHMTGYHDGGLVQQHGVVGINIAYCYRTDIAVADAGIDIVFDQTEFHGIEGVSPLLKTIDLHVFVQKLPDSYIFNLHSAAPSGRQGGAGWSLGTAVVGVI